MSVYYMNEGAFELPDATVADRTTHVVEAPNGEHRMTLVVCRAPVPVGKSLRQLAQGRVLDEMTRIPGYSVIEERESEGLAWDGMPVLEVTSRWRHEGEAIYQQQAHLAPGGMWIFLAVSTPFEVRAAADSWFARIRASFRLRSAE